MSKKRHPFAIPNFKSSHLPNISQLSVICTLLWLTGVSFSPIPALQPSVHVAPAARATCVRRRPAAPSTDVAVPAYQPHPPPPRSEVTLPPTPLATVPPRARRVTAPSKSRPGYRSGQPSAVSRQPSVVSRTACVRHWLVRSAVGRAGRYDRLRSGSRSGPPPCRVGCSQAGQAGAGRRPAQGG